MRKDGTKPEALLWTELRANRLGGHHFVRQLPIGPYIADFACRKAKLVIELDGSQHAESRHDRRRDEFVRGEQWATLRFWNEDVVRRRAEVCQTILAAIEGRLAEDVSAVDMRFVFGRAVGNDLV
jgi:very-short-patch-repair endonuclease